jgi:prepilin-type N-terminal cleavage/methylation domain-containing protein
MDNYAEKCFRGFTLTELAIVLVVIGVILGLVYRSIALVDAAKTKYEVQKIIKYQNAVAGWVSINSRNNAAFEFPKISSTVLDSSVLLDLKVGDRRNPYGDWLLVLGTMPNDGTAGMPSETGNMFILMADDVSVQFVCQLESAMDNKNTATGNARSTLAAFSFAQGCDSLDNTGQSSAKFFYKLF